MNFPSGGAKYFDWLSAAQPGATNRSDSSAESDLLDLC